jgi:hypothetical protein
MRVPMRSTQKRDRALLRDEQAASQHFLMSQMSYELRGQALLGFVR